MADFYSGGDQYSTGKSKINDVYLVHSPLARQTFLDLNHSKRPYDVRMTAFHQVLKGLAHLHRHGIMHRDLKPTNMMIVSYSPMHAIIIDYGSASFDSMSTDHFCGTIAYLAPEVLKLKYEKAKTVKHEPYDCRVDVWSIGLSGYQLFFQEPCRWEKGVNTVLHRDISQKLKSRSGSVADVLGEMLSWHKSHRPTVQQILQLDIWSKYGDPDDGLDHDQLLSSPQTAKRLKN